MFLACFTAVPIYVPFQLFNARIKPMPSANISTKPAPIYFTGGGLLKDAAGESLERSRRLIRCICAHCL